MSVPGNENEKLKSDNKFSGKSVMSEVPKQWVNTVKITSNGTGEIIRAEAYSHYTVGRKIKINIKKWQMINR